MPRIRVEQVGRPLNAIAKSAETKAQLEPIADQIFEAASNDSNPDYVASLRKRPFLWTGPGGRWTWQIGAAPTIGARVEAKRGTMGRAVGQVR